MNAYYLAGTHAALEKYAAKINVIHGTSGRWNVLRPGVGKTVAANDPNPRAVYFGTSNRKLRPHISTFAANAVESRGTGEPVIAHAKLDSKEGWGPRTLTAWGRSNIGTVDDAQDLWRSLDSLTGAERGATWEKIQRGVGSWVNQDPTTTVRPTTYRPARR